MTRPLLGLIAALALGTPVLAQPAAPANASRSAATPAIAARLGRGLNILGYDPIWSDPAKARFKPADFARIRSGGFQTVRVNLQAFHHMDAQGVLEPGWLQTLDWVVRNATDAGLNVVLDEHDFNVCSDDVAACRTRLLQFWSQVAPRYKDAPSSVLFEILNEPHGQITPQVWNTLFPQALSVIRQSNPTRAVVVGPGHWNSLKDLDQLELPADPNLVVTFHYYEPMTFTHQGAAWNEATAKLSGVTWGSPADLAQLNRNLDIVQAWGRAHDRPVWLGEFGAYDKVPMPLRARYDGAVARAAEAHGIPWAYWQFDSDFIVFDVAKDSWVEPIWRALIPDAPAS